MKKIPLTPEASEKLIDRYAYYSKSEIPVNVIDLLLKDFELEQYDKDEFFCRENGPANKTGLLISGNAKALTTCSNTKQVNVLKFFIENDFLSADNPHKNNSSDRDIIFTEPSIILVVNDLSKALTKVIDGFPEINNIMLAMYMEEVENVRHIAYMRGITKAKERVQYFFEHFNRYAQFFTGEEIANFIGLQRETFSRNKMEALKSIKV